MPTRIDGTRRHHVGRCMSAGSWERLAVGRSVGIRAAYKSWIGPVSFTGFVCTVPDDMPTSQRQMCSHLDNSLG